jgi:beta-lactamase superfamily II metal-dependent hydrolase
MIFSLEALEAQHGDSLLLHYGSKSSPKLVVIDGGPKGTFSNSLQPRLEELRQSRAGGDKLPIRLLMVSHIDEDHVQGVLDLVGVLQQAKEDKVPRPYEVTTLWHNSFDDVVAKLDKAELLTATAPALGEGETKLLVASVPQGRDLRNGAKKLGIVLNSPFKGLIVAPKTGKKTVSLGNSLSLTVIGPAQAQLDALKQDWAKKIAAMKKKGTLKPAAMQAQAAEFVDKSVYNLSSLVVLAQVGKRRMLLTGDARGDFLLDGLRSAGLLKKAPFHVDIFKLPHHGSIRNVRLELFEQITADHYVVSANGKFGNPDLPTLKLLIEARGKDKYTIHLTNPVPKVMTFLKKAKTGKNFKISVRDPEALSVVVDLGDALED